MNFPLLGINIFYEENGNNTNERPEYFKSSTIVKKEGIKVGIIGAIMPNIDSDIIANIADDYIYDSSLNLIEEEANRLRNEENCDVVVLSTHDGQYQYYDDVTDVIDAVFLGHDHNLKEGKYRDSNVPYVEGRNYGSYLSHISLDLKLNSENHYEVVDSNVENIETFNNSLFSEESKEVNDTYEVYKEEIESIRDEVLYTFDRQISKSEFSRYIAYSLKEYATNIDPKLPIDSAFINSGGVRDNVAIGEFTYGDLLRVYPFENKVAILEFDDYTMYNAFISTKSNVVRNDPIISSKEGKYYCATIDYVALSSYGYSNTYYLDDFARDVVAFNLKNNGYVSL